MNVNVRLHIHNGAGVTVAVVVGCETGLLNPINSRVSCPGRDTGPGILAVRPPIPHINVHVTGTGI